jgi:hypothetical protein
VDIAELRQKTAESAWTGTLFPYHSGGDALANLHDALRIMRGTLAVCAASAQRFPQGTLTDMSPLNNRFVDGRDRRVEATRPSDR